MTDKFPRRIGGDGDGPAETPTERLLREAMGARAALVTANSLRPAAPPKSRIRRLRPVYAVTVPLGLAAAMALGVLTFHGEPVAHDQTPPPPAASLTTSPSPTAEPTVTPTPSATPTATDTTTGEPETDLPLADGTPSSSASATNTAPPVGPATSYSFRGVKFKVPAGWKTVPLDASTVCVLSPGAPTDSSSNWSQDECEPYGVYVTVYNTPDESAHAIWPTMGDMASSSGWSHQPSCPIWGHPYIPTGPYSSVSPAVRTRPTIAGKTGDKTQWKATCKPGDSFTSQMWALSSDQVYVAASGLKDDYQAGLQAIVNSLDVSGHKAPGVASEAPDPPAVNRDTVAVTYSGILPGGMVSVKDPLPVSIVVTYRNTGTVNLPAVQPLVFTDPYPGTPNSPIPMNVGTLERQDGGTWTKVSMSPGSGMDYATAGKAAAFPLAPGASHTVMYRMSVDPADGPGIMPIRMQATLPYDGSGSLTVIGEKIAFENIVR
ncbi:hypothetical protein ACIRST_29205 [Kitasatospora sp. NPDC101447]|uniref:hypothetical protein n=1 Tax=Kitasatospora sp. NPDC101447 TaxID=3364102 RepID=UPI003809244B